MRSALVLKMLQFGPTGALLAAATTSLPETIGEERNWDYRFCWLRDASMTVAVLHRIGHPWMATRFIDWMLRTVPTKDDSLQIMYGIRGEKDLTEKTLEHLSGYQGSRPVRVGNAAYTQEQHDIFGVVMDVIYQDLTLRQRTPESLDRIWTRVARSSAPWPRPGGSRIAGSGRFAARSAISSSPRCCAGLPSTGRSGSRSCSTSTAGRSRRVRCSGKSTTTSAPAAGMRTRGHSCSPTAQPTSTPPTC